MAIRKSDLQPGFKDQVTDMPGGELVKRCFDCGTCAGICPVSQQYPLFDPRKILHMIRLGLKERLLSSKSLWYCSHCDTCLFVCPQNVRFSDVVDILREMAFKEGYADSTRYQQWGTAPCKAGCPAHISIPGFIGAIQRGDYLDGLKLIKEEMPFPSVCGRICPHPCEGECNRGKTDQPLAIETLKRFLADMDSQSETPYVPNKKEEKEKKVAVIGAGPAGLTVAYYLAIYGYPVSVFEKLPVAGGMMAVGIPEFRLPRQILQAEIDVIKKLGVKINLNVEIGKDIGLETIQKDFQAVFIGVGCHQAPKLGIPGEDTLDGVIDGIDFLREVHLGHPLRPENKLVVIGGGNTAVDCARVAKRLGYENVSILYRRTQDEMPASPWEIEEAIEEDIKIQYLTAPVKILEDHGKVCGLECVRMELGDADASGRRRPMPIQSSEYIIETDIVIPAISQEPDLRCLTDECAMTITKMGLIIADPLTGKTNIPGTFAGGDVVTGPRTIVEAVAFGKKAAHGIHCYLNGEETIVDLQENWFGCTFTPDTATSIDRESAPCLPPNARKRTFREVCSGFDEQQAKKEAGRCFRVCGIQTANVDQ